ncbi:hypothetical protein BDZ89DRAFT_1055254 [Hymenopellis radicata]|nr:hypothetical protein BDZ89DRAFT_1055254 [Hymenopellis radicata]
MCKNASVYPGVCRRVLVAQRPTPAPEWAPVKTPYPFRVNTWHSGVECGYTASTRKHPTLVDVTKSAETVHQENGYWAQDNCGQQVNSEKGSDLQPNSGQLQSNSNQLRLAYHYL